MTDGPHPDDPRDPSGGPRPQPARSDLPEPPWFAMRGPEPPRGSPHAPPYSPQPGFRSPESWSAELEQLAAAGQQRSRGPRRVPTGLLVVLGLLVVIGAVVGVVVAVTSGGATTTPRATQPFCAPGTRGTTTTVASGQQPDTTGPASAVVAFLSAAVTDRSLDAARTTLSATAVTPSSTALDRWIAALPPTTDGWCADITPESPSRLTVSVRVRTADGVGVIAQGDTFYVSSPAPGRWTIDAIVTGRR